MYSLIVYLVIQIMNKPFPHFLCCWGKGAGHWCGSTDLPLLETQAPCSLWQDKRSLLQQAMLKWGVPTEALLLKGTPLPPLGCCQDCFFPYIFLSFLHLLFCPEPAVWHHSPADHNQPWGLVLSLANHQTFSSWSQATLGSCPVLGQSSDIFQLIINNLWVLSHPWPSIRHFPVDHKELNNFWVLSSPGPIVRHFPTDHKQLWGLVLSSANHHIFQLITCNVWVLSCPQPSIWHFPIANNFGVLSSLQPTVRHFPVNHNSHTAAGAYSVPC